MPDYQYDTLIVERTGNVLTITLNRPESLNAINEVVHREIEDVFHEVGRDADAGAVVFTGAGQGFCSDGDVRALDERGGQSSCRTRPSAPSRPADDASFRTSCGWNSRSSAH